MPRVLTPADRVAAGSGPATPRPASVSRPASTAGGSSIDERLELLRQACDELQGQSERQAVVNTRLRNELCRVRRRNAELRNRLKEAGVKL